MRIVRSEQTRRTYPVRHLFRRRKILLIALLIGLYTVVVFATGVISYRTHTLQSVAQSARQVLAVGPNYVRGLLFASPRHLVLDIKHLDYQQLAYKRETALERGILVADGDDYVSATLDDGTQKYEVRLRLKGDEVDHLQDEKWSFRVRVRGEQTLFGMKQFSLQNPKTRLFLGEWIYHKLLQREDVPALRYAFVNLTLNGRDLGVYALEEHFEKRLIEHNRRREGPILRFNEDLFWQEFHINRTQFTDFEAGGRLTSGSYESSVIDGFHADEQLADSALAPMYLKAVSLMEALRTGQRLPSEVFDVQTTASFLAVTDLTGARHALSWNNLRFYFNPLTERFEPIGYDAFDQTGRHRIQSLAGDMTVYEAQKFYPVIDRLLSDPVILKAYYAALARLSEPAYLDAFWADVEDELEANLNIIHTEFPSYRFSRADFYENQRYIRHMLAPVQGLHAYWNRLDRDTLRLDLGTIQPVLLEVVHVTTADSVRLMPTRKTLLRGKPSEAPVRYQTASFLLPATLDWADSLQSMMTVAYRLAGTETIRQAPVFAHPRGAPELTKRIETPSAVDLKVLSFLHIDEASRNILVRPGRWTLDQPLVFPKGYTVSAGPGTELDLTDGGSVWSYAALRFMGTADQPIRIHSSDSTGLGWVVMEADTTSVLHHVVFENLRAPARPGSALTGAVTFYEAPVDLSHVSFLNQQAEDALNIIRTTFDIRNSLFSGSASDAFDADFTEGRFADTRFIDSGNDALDLSGSLVEVDGVTIRGAGDKGLSAGENSRLTVRHTTIERAEIAVAGKDLSTVELEASSITASRVGFTVFQKKPEFGPAVVTGIDLNMANIEVLYLLEQGSTLMLNRESIVPNREDVRDVLYGVEYGKASE